MSFIKGETLADYFSNAQGGKLPLDEALQIGIQLCTVLDYLHNQQPAIIFRDLKPTNIMRMPDGHIYLIDFGIARHFKPGQAKDTAYYGSMGYAPPEQYGKAQTTPQSDIYSLGATLHQLLSGHDPSSSPFRFPLLSSLMPSVPASLAALITQMLELDEEKRPASVLLVKQELQRIVSPPSQISIPAQPMAVSIETANQNTSKEQALLTLLKSFQPQQGFYVSPNIPNAKFTNAREARNVLPNEQVLALIDCSLLGFAEKCVLFGNKGIYHYQLFDQPRSILYTDFPHYTFTGSTSSGGGYVNVSNKQRFVQSVSLSGSSVSAVLLCKMLNAIKVLFS
jgi:serine/threonine protein kinase